MKISIVIPVYNEWQGLEELQARLLKVLESLHTSKGYTYEIIYVDDGSRDRSFKVMEELAMTDSHTRAIGFTRNFGQTAAIKAGIDHATGDIIVPMDADLENEPEDIPRLIAEIEEGYDVVSGWRKDRFKNQFITRRLPSEIANRLIGLISELHLHDFGCTLKAYKAIYLKDLKLSGDMHRFLPAYAYWQGARVAEIPVSFKDRKYGSSKYGLSRIFKVILDLVALKFILKHSSNPIRFFGFWGLVAISIGLLSGFTAIGLRLAGIVDLILTPLPLLAAFLITVGVQLVMMGILADISLRHYRESQDIKGYRIKGNV